MQYNFIKTRLENHRFYLTLARPEKRNAFTPTMVNEIYHAIQEANRNPEVRIVIVNAEGPVFCAGMDLKAFNDPSKDLPNPEIVNIDISLGEVFHLLNKPSVALVEGNAYAGAFLILLECTYVFAQPQVMFALTEVTIGIFPFQVLHSLLRIMPQNKAMDLCISGTPFSAVKARELGIVYDFLEEEKVEELINKITANAPLAISKGYEVMRKLPEIAEDKKFEYLLEVLQELKSSEDAQEGIKALFEKRKPVWKNR